MMSQVKYQVMRDKDFNYFANGQPIRVVAANDIPETVQDLKDCSLIDRHRSEFRELSVVA